MWQEAESLDFFSPILLLRILLVASFTRRPVWSSWAQCLPWQGPKHTGFMSRPGISQCVVRWPKGLLGSSAFTVGYRHLFPVYSWSLLLKSILKWQPPQRSSSAAVRFEHKGKWKETGPFHSLTHPGHMEGGWYSWSLKLERCTQAWSRRGTCMPDGNCFRAGWGEHQGASDGMPKNMFRARDTGNKTQLWQLLSLVLMVWEPHRCAFKSKLVPHTHKCHPQGREPCG